MRFLSLLSASLAIITGVVTASNVVDLDDKNFDSIIGKDRPALVEFYAPWCGHCKNLAPVYEQLADAFPSNKVIIAKTDADGVGKGLGSRFGVQGFPTLKWFPANGGEPVDYQSGRDLESLASFVAKESSVKSKIKPPPPPAAVQLDSSNFDDIALDNDKNVLVAFTAPWCGHCKNMKPAYEKVASAFSSESDCVVAQMDADNAANKPVAGRYGVKSFPTIKFFPKGSSEPIMYESGRSEEQFIDFLNEHCGTSRTVGGLLSATAGKVLGLDTIASSFFTAPTTERPAVLEKAKAYLGSLGASADKKTNASAEYYVKAMERIMSKGESWLVKEQARIAGLLGSTNLAPTKLDELKIKANILTSFAASKIEEAVDAAGSFAQDATASVKSAAYQGTASVASAAGQATEEVKSAAGQAAEGVDAFVQMMEDKTGGKIQGEL